MAVVTDSTCDLATTLLQQLGIAMVPLMLTVDGTTYRDQVDISADRYLALLPEVAQIPKTSAPSPGVLAACYRQALREGASEVVSIHLSGRLSATLRAAKSAQSMVGDRVEVVDSQSVSLGLGLLVWWAALSARHGSSAEEVAAEVRSLASRLELSFSPVTLDYLARGGRVGGAARWVGSLLDMKPVLTCEQGSIQTFKRIRGARQIVPAIVQALRLTVPPGSAVLAGVIHAQNEEEASRLEEAMRSTWEVEDLVVALCGPVLATHGGPGTFGGVVLPLNPDERHRWRQWRQADRGGEVRGL